MRLIDGHLPAGVAVVEAFRDAPHPLLFPDEEAVVAQAVPKRRREFATARDCARQALAHLGVGPVSIVPGPRGAPRWPAGVVGSITHCDGYRAAAVGRVDTVAGLGIDAEPHAPLPSDVLDVVALSNELDSLQRLTHARPTVCWDRLLFCAKEAVYKAWFPLTGQVLDFEDAEVTFDPGGTFIAHLTGAPPGAASDPGVPRLAGRWATTTELVGTAIALTPR